MAGYDLPKLYTGSFGTLGLISEVTFKVMPWPGALIRSPYERSIAVGSPRDKAAFTGGAATIRRYASARRPVI